jgi:hypothetical protein
MNIGDILAPGRRSRREDDDVGPELQDPGLGFLEGEIVRDGIDDPEILVAEKAAQDDQVGRLPIVIGHRGVIAVIILEIDFIPGTMEEQDFTGHRIYSRSGIGRRGTNPADGDAGTVY